MAGSWPKTAEKDMGLAKSQACQRLLGRGRFPAPRVMSSFSIASLCRPELAELSAYLPDLASYRVRLDANEAPPIMSAEARQRVAEVLAGGAWERYPDPTLTSLRQAIAKSLDVTAAEVLPGVGSDEVISLLLTAFVKP